MEIDIIKKDLQELKKKKKLLEKIFSKYKNELKKYEEKIDLEKIDAFNSSTFYQQKVRGD